MKPNTKAILINSETKTISEILISTLTDLQEAVGGYIEVATTYVKLGKENTVYVNEEGLFSSHDNWFVFRGAHQPFKGSGIIVGTNSEGETVDTNLTAGQAAMFITFHTTADVREMAE